MWERRVLGVSSDRQSPLLPQERTAQEPSHLGAVTTPDPAGSVVRLVPGAGANFASSWQRQFDLERERRAALARGRRIENDTLFAFEFDRCAAASSRVTAVSQCCVTIVSLPRPRPRAATPPGG